MELSNLHSHTFYCDGECSADEMVRGAIEKGFTTLGFSGHAHTPGGFGEMTAESSLQYISDVRAAQEKYAGQIEVFCGVEQDYLSDTETGMYDYVIGAVHSMTLPDGTVHNVDYIERKSCETVNHYFGGDFYAYAGAYFEREANVAVVTQCDIVAHFDLITKFNEGMRLFDESNPRYVSAAIDAMAGIMKTCRLFEVNTGAMYRVGRTLPYPARFLLKELLTRGGEVILTSDSHNTGSLGYKFPEAEQLLREVGFKYRKALTKNGFIDIKL